LADNELELLTCAPMGAVARAAPSCDFRTIQAYPKDLRALPVHPEPAVSWHSGFRGGAHARHKTTPVHHAAWRSSRVARAQQPQVPFVGYFSGRSPDAEAPLRIPFLKALAQQHYV